MESRVIWLITTGVVVVILTIQATQVRVVKRKMTGGRHDGSHAVRMLVDHAGAGQIQRIHLTLHHTPSSSSSA